jgi:L-methionine (R)-S-oxide reductase
MEVEDAIRAILERPEGREWKAQRVAEAIRRTGGYRWVGIYDVGSEEIAVLGWSGPGPPEHLRFPVTQGLCGAAAGQRATIVVGDVAADPRYLSTFGTTRSEIVVPVREADGESVVGLIDAESQQRDAFGDLDRALLELCALQIATLWG